MDYYVFGENNAIPSDKWVSEWASAIVVAVIGELGPLVQSSAALTGKTVEIEDIIADYVSDAVKDHVYKAGSHMDELDMLREAFENIESSRRGYGQQVYSILNSFVEEVVDETKDEMEKEFDMRLRDAEAKWESQK